MEHLWATASGLKTDLWHECTSATNLNSSNILLATQALAKEELNLQLFR